jgi:GNAT superfamily N-acetyltransferase
MGWVVARHGEVYFAEYGWDERFEALVAGIVADYMKGCDPSCEGCWIAEVGGRRAGSIMVIRESADTAKLRLLLVEPEARGLGIGQALLGRGMDFARTAGYKRLILWTNSVLKAAGHIYRKAGFRLASEEPHRQWGVELMGQVYEIEL